MCKKLPFYRDFSGASKFDDPVTLEVEMKKKAWSPLLKGLATG
jgi:hypothetical protein